MENRHQFVKNGNQVIVQVYGKLDAMTSPEIENELKNEVPEVNNIIFDFTNLEYISSSGLRLLLVFLKLVDKKGKVIVRNATGEVKNVLDMSGFSNIITLDETINTLTVEAKMENLDKVVSFVEKSISGLDCSFKVKYQINLAVEEIFTNIANYAYPEDKVGEVGVKIEVTDNPITVALTFIDDGHQYDPLSNEDPDVNANLDERQVGGLGIFLVKQTMDDISYEYKNGKNILTLKKEVK